ncbi:MAG: hypothetical protein NC397_02350 [Clostridium sp.]|nr:hypothetical protein [Clostridium sp.]
MFNVNTSNVENILKDYHIDSKIKQITELQRYNYENNNSNLKQVRLIVKVELENALSLVIRFKNEADVSIELIESQSLFADALRSNGIITPYQYKTGDKFAKHYRIYGYDVIVTVEQFVENEIKIVDTEVAKKTGILLAKMHTISEANNFHINNKVLFDPFENNELFDFKTFISLGETFENDERVLFDKIVSKYNDYMEILSPLKQQSRYAVQGDISNCNLYHTDLGEIGIFDFNRAGDNELFCDAVMQAVFEARLMDYPEDKEDNFEPKILISFLEGYNSVRSFSKEQQYWYPYLYAIINAFWSSDIRWSENSLLNAHKNGKVESVRRWLLMILKRLELSS